MDNPEQLVLNRRRLSLGKYTSWAADLTDEQMYGLLNSIQEPGRARTGLLGALGFVHGHPLNQEQAMQAIRNAFTANPTA